MHKLASVVEKLERLIADTWQRLLRYHPADELQALADGDAGDPFLQACANIRAWENARPKERALMAEWTADVERIKADPELYQRIRAHIGKRGDTITVTEHADDWDGEPAHFVYASEAARQVEQAEKIRHETLTFENATQEEIDAECAQIEAEAGDNVTIKFTIIRLDPGGAIPQLTEIIPEAEQPKPETPSEIVSKPEKPKKRRRRAKKLGFSGAEPKKQEQAQTPVDWKALGVKEQRQKSLEMQAQRRAEQDAAAKKRAEQRQRGNCWRRWNLPRVDDLKKPVTS